MPIQYKMFKDPNQIKVDEWYDLIFIDGNHSYPFVRKDYECYRNRTRLLCFHDINDHICTDVVRLWKEIKLECADVAHFFEFIEHPNDLHLMGIGVVAFTGLHQIV